MMAFRTLFGSLGVLLPALVAALALARPTLAVAACGDGIVDGGEQCDDGNTAAGDCCSATCSYDALLTPCADGNFCTTGPAVCDGAGRCLEGGDADCGADIDHYKCYQAAVTKGTVKPIPTAVMVEDIFTTPPVLTAVRKQGTVCNPVDKNGEGIDAPNAHLTCYATKDDKSRKFVQQDIAITNQFGAQTVTVQKPYQLCVPGEQGIAPNPPTPSLDDIDHYRCYKAKPKKGSATVDGVLVELQDQFETRRAYVKPQLRFCAPADKNGEGVDDPDAFLTCYKLVKVPADTTPPFQPIKINIANQFTPTLGGSQLTARPLPHLCVPSIQTP